MYETTRDTDEGYFREFDGITYEDECGERVAIANEGDTGEDGPLLTIDGALTLAQLHELVHKLTQAIAPGVTARQTAQWATGETLTEAGDSDDNGEG